MTATVERSRFDQRSRAVSNALSVDVEGFVESNRQSVDIPARYVDSAREDSEITANVAATLELLGELSIKASFFFLGRIGRDLPKVVRDVADAGHEIGSHSFDHLRVFGTTRSEFREAARRSKQLLEDASGMPVLGFRAPDFSINRSSSWAFDELREAGYEYDSSVYPIAGHDVYGIPDAQRFIHTHASGLVEFPLATATILGRRIPFGGGGYFRLYPLAVTSYLMRQWNGEGNPCMFYIHPYEIGPVIPTIWEMSRYRRFRHYWHCANGAARFRELLRHFRFTTAVNVLQSGGWLGDLNA